MKKILPIIMLAFMVSTNASAQNDSEWTLNTRFWCTNYWTTMIAGAAEGLIKEFAVSGDGKDSLLLECLIPNPDLVFPIGMSKRGFDNADIYGPYHRAFANPFKHIGDYAIGADVSWRASGVGFYAGTYFKSQEICFKDSKDNLRGFYIQPRAGLILGSKKHAFEAGAFYDIVTGCGGSVEPTDKGMLKSGVGLDFAFSSTDKKGGKMLIQFSMPLHNFFDTDYKGLQGMKRKVGYIMLTQRVTL
jgi:hypothetical protein